MSPTSPSRIDPPPVVIGIVGGIGAGKSTVARAFASLGVPVFDADRNAKAHLDDEAVKDELGRRFGDGIIGADGSIDRGALASVVFSDRSKLKELERVLHPLVLGDQHAFIADAQQTGALGVVIDAPLLLEAGFDAYCHELVFVDASRKCRLGRVRSSRGWTEADFDAREASQWATERKKARCGHVIRNDTDDPPLEGQIRSILATIGIDQTH